MKQLSSYVSRTVLAAMLLTMVLLLGLEMVFGFIGGLEDVHGAYTAYEVLVYTVLSSPARAYELLPIAALVGGITGLGLLAGASELVVMRAAGVSVARIVWWVMRPALILAVAGILLGQFVVPRTGTTAELRRAQAHGYQVGARGNYWHREGEQVVHVGQVNPDGVLSEVVFYRQRGDGQLEGLQRAAQARYLSGVWHLEDIHVTSVAADGTSRVEYAAERLWPTQLTPEFLRLVTLDPETLSLTDLRHYATYMKAQGLDSGSYFLEFWKKAFAPLATLSMVLIACSFIFGPLRSVNMGLRILAGVLAGLLFRYFQDFFGYASLVYDFSPVLAAAVPICASIAVGGFALSRVR